MTWFRGSGVPRFRGSKLRSSAALSVVVAIAVAALRATSATPASAGDPPTFAADIAPILYANCVVCHRPGQAAPFSLLTYDDAKRRGKTMVAATGRRYMPPWHASRADGFPEFRDERHLGDEQIATIKQWFDAGMPSGDLAKAPAPPEFPAGWLLGAPDLVLTLPQPIDVAPDGPDQYRNVVLPIDLPDDRWITAIDFEPSARKVLHHALFFVGPAGAPVGTDEIVPGLGGAGRRGRGAGIDAAAQTAAGLGGWVPGMTPRFYPDGIAQPLPKHSNLILQLHLHPSGKPEREQGRLALYLSPSTPAKSMTSVQVPPAFGFAMGINIPADEPHYVVKDSFVLPVALEAYGARGHAHYLCREMKMTATLPDGSTRGLLWIKDWDFGWQDSYFYKAPFTLPKHTRIDAELVYDNSGGNPKNPNAPPKRVLWGRGSLDEMGSMSLLVTAPGGADADLLRTAQAQHLREQVIRMMTGR